MDVVGYTDRPSVRAGETVRFMVSCRAPSYRADVVRLIHGDANPSGPGVRVEAFDADVNGEYAGREQVIRKGSCIVVRDGPVIHDLKSVTMTAWIWPTTPDKGLQGILTKWSGEEGKGFGLFINESGCLSFRVGGGEVNEVSSGVPLHRWLWYFVAASFDAGSGEVVLYQAPVSEWPGDGLGAVTRSGRVGSGVGVTDAPLIMAAFYNGTENGKLLTDGHFNGKIDRPRLFNAALGVEELGAVERGAGASGVADSSIGEWDFWRDMVSMEVKDGSGRGLDGRIVNRPARAMTGYNWTSRENAFVLRPEEYGAIHFHDDDLGDANWDADFEFTVPEGMRSGVYAARLQAGEATDYVPFFVRPETGAPTAPAAFLVPTFSYMAYGDGRNTDETEGNFGDYFLPGFEYPVKPEDHYIVDNGLTSCTTRTRMGQGCAIRRG